jgi:hypothetical protein
MPLAALVKVMFEIFEVAPGLPLGYTELAPCNDLGGERQITRTWE